MIPSNRFATTLESLADLIPEIHSAQADPKSILPPLRDVLAEFSPLPYRAVFLGLAGDGLPVLLNLEDPVPGPILIVGDPGCGKTSLLKTVAQSVKLSYQPDEVKTIILSDHWEDWMTLGTTKIQEFCPIHDPQTSRVIASLSTEAHQERNDHCFVLLLIDDLESLLNHLHDNQDLRWLLLRGPARHIWPIVTMNSKKMEGISPLLGAFRTRIFGHIKDDDFSSGMTNINGNPFKLLVPGSQFAIREGNSWLQFWIPNLE